MPVTFLRKSLSHSRAPVRPIASAARRLVLCSLALGLFSGVVGSAISPGVSAAATSKNKTLFIAVSNSYGAAVTEFNLVVDSFSACTGAACVSAAIEGAGDTEFYKATVALEKRAPYPSGISKDLTEYIGNLIAVQKDINTVAKATTIARQKTAVTNALELDVDNLAFRGMHILIFLGELKKF
jgi:hypothetical protein